MKRILFSRLMIGLLGGTLCAATLLVFGCTHADRGHEPEAVSDTAQPHSPVPPATPEADGPIQLRDVTSETGISFLHTDGSSGRYFIVEAMSTGLTTLDFDGDGLLDIYFPNGAPLPGMEPEVPPRHALYRNLGNWRFQEVTDAANVVCHAYGLGVVAGDYDQDGFPDIYLNNFGLNVLYRNNGDGTFSDVTEQAGVAGPMVVGAGACFLDADANGDLDLYVGNYIELDLDAHITRRKGSVPFYPSPREYAPVPDTLYRNNGDGTFTDISLESGIAAKAGRSMGMITVDYDEDGATDVFICNDVQENFLFRNNGQGQFEEVATLVGLAFNGEGEVLANMAVDCGQVDRGGRRDFFTTNYQDQSPVLFRNLGNGFFADVTRMAKAGQGCFEHVNWGLGFADLDNDGHLDLYVANGHTEDTLEQLGMVGTHAARNVVLRNNGKGVFEDVSERCGDGLLPEFVSRGVVLDDLDNDGDIDVVVVNSRDQPTVLRNVGIEDESAGHWLQIQLRGIHSNRDGVGARVAVEVGDVTMLDEVHSGRGYQSHWGSVLQFGLGERRHVDRITVHWLGGAVSQFENLDVDQRVVLFEGRDTVERFGWDSR